MIDKISVIVPAFNAGNTLRDCLDSILTQSYSNIEVVVVDDGSTDETYSIIQQYEQMDSRVIGYRKTNGGQSSARNFGLRLITGSYFLYIDSDDVVLPNIVQELYNTVIYQDVNISMCGLVYKTDSYENKMFCDIGRIDGRESIIKAFLQERIMHGPVCKLYKSDIYKDIEFKEGIIFEDVEYLSRVYLKTDSVAICDYPGYVFYVRQGSTTHSVFSEKYLDILKVTALIEDRIKESGLLCEKELSAFVLKQYITFLGYVIHAKMEAELEKTTKPLFAWLHHNLISILKNHCVRFNRKLLSIVLVINSKYLNRLVFEIKG